jgi:hypothetical protein
MTDRPLCRYCGKPIRKRTGRIFFGASQDQVDRGSSIGSWTYRAEKPRTKEEAQRLSNHEIVSAKWSRGDSYWAKEAGFDHIIEAGTWDGVSYEDPFFCNGEHAKRFAYAAARAGHAMPAYIDARAKKGS